MREYGDIPGDWSPSISAKVACVADRGMRCTYTSVGAEALHSRKMPLRLDHFALYGVPILAGLITGGVLLTSASERPVFGARVYGHVSMGADRVALRVHTRQHLRGGYDDFAAPLTVRVADSGRTLGEAQSAVPASVADVVVPLSQPIARPVDVTVLARGVELARARVEPLSTLEARPLVPFERSQGEAKLTVALARGFAVAEMPETLTVVAELPLGDAPTLDADTIGADLPKPQRPTTECVDDRCRHTWTLSVTPHAPAVELTAVVRKQGEEVVRWSGPLSVVVGGLWVDPKVGSSLHLQSPVPREEAFVSLVTTTGRYWGARVALETDESDTSRGVVPLPSLPDDSVTAIVSTEPNEPETASVPWPLRGAPLEGGRVTEIADGMAAAIAAEESRQAEARRPAFGLIVAAGLFELVYLWWRTRRSRMRLEQHLAQEKGAERSAAPSLPLSALVVLSGALALAFAILATVSAFR